MAFGDRVRKSKMYSDGTDRRQSQSDFERWLANRNPEPKVYVQPPTGITKHWAWMMGWKSGEKNNFERIKYVPDVICQPGEHKPGKALGMYKSEFNNTCGFGICSFPDTKDWACWVQLHGQHVCTYRHRKHLTYVR